MGDHALVSWIPADRLAVVLQPEPAVLILLSIVAAWIGYKTLLRGLSSERHLRLRGLFRNVGWHTLASIAFLALYWALDNHLEGSYWVRVVPNIGLIALIWWSIVLIKIFRVFVFEYLFFTNMRAGVPVLIVNLLTLLLSCLVAAGILAGIFNFHLAPLLATSAVFSIVLGLALQDTLGNLVAGVALQFDKPYSIGDWIEVSNPANSQKTIGQVREISWRAVNLISFTEETITIPNRVVAQAEISNFSGRDRPFLRGQFYKIPYGHSLEKVRPLLLGALESIPGVRKVPVPIVLFLESNESWMLLKLIYSLHDFGAQFTVADQVNSSVIARLTEAGIPIASHRIEMKE